jgi:hypothetical protein
MGFPTELVFKPSLVVDGTIDAKGGTVRDETFGARVLITLPVNTLDEPTEVAIDDFASLKGPFSGLVVVFPQLTTFRQRGALL